MKKLILLLLLLASSVWAAEPVELARMNLGIAGASVAAGLTCNTTTPYVSQLNDDNQAGHTADGATYMGQGNFSPAADIQVCRVDIKFDLAVGSPSGQYYRIDIYNYTSTALNTLLGSSSVYQSDGSAGWKTFTFSSPVSLSSGTSYFIGVVMSEGNDPFTLAFDATNYFKFGIQIASPSISGTRCFYYSNKTLNGCAAAWDFALKIYRME